MNRKYAIRCASGYVRDAVRGAPIFVSDVNRAKGFNTTQEAWTWIRMIGLDLPSPQVVVKPTKYQRESYICMHTREFNTGAYRTCRLCNRKRP